MTMPVPADRLARIAHNLAVVQSRKGWTKAQALQAIVDAKNSVIYDRPDAQSQE